LRKTDATHERGDLTLLEITEAVLLAEVPAMIGKPREANHPDIGNRQLFDLENFHALDSLSEATIAC